MVKKLLIRLLFEFGGKILKSVSTAYREVLKSGRKPNDNSNSKFSMSNLMNNPMTKDEALKILNLKEKDLHSKEIMEKFDKYMECNDPSKGGSFYIQNKVYYAKEFLMQDFPPEENVSKHNPGYEESEKKEDEAKTEEKKEAKDGESGEQKEEGKKEEEKVNKARIFMSGNFKV